MPQLFKDVTVPDAVAKEFGESLPTNINIYEEPLDPNLLRFAEAFLDKGESEVITLAIQTNAQGVVIDEKKGRKIAKGLGLKVIGTLGLLAIAYQKGIIDDIETVIDEIKNDGFHISDHHVETILKK